MWCNRSLLTNLLCLTVVIRNPNLISTLIDVGANVNLRAIASMKSLIYVVVESGNANSFQILIGSCNKIDDWSDWLFFYVAVEMGRDDLMEAICLAFPNIDLNAVNSNGQTPLHITTTRGCVDSIRFLMSIDIDPDAVDVDGWTPLHHAAHVTKAVGWL